MGGGSSAMAGGGPDAFVLPPTSHLFQSTLSPFDLYSRFLSAGDLCLLISQSPKSNSLHLSLYLRWSGKTRPHTQSESKMLTVSFDLNIMLTNIFSHLSPWITPSCKGQLLRLFIYVIVELRAISES